MIHIYTDTTISNNTAFCTSFIITDTNFLGFITKVYNNVRGSINGELLAILQGLRYLRKFPFRDDVTVYTDSKEAIQHINHQTHEEHYKSIILEIDQFKKESTVIFSYIKGHSLVHSPNKIVDLTSRSIKDIVLCK